MNLSNEKTITKSIVIRSLRNKATKELLGYIIFTSHNESENLQTLLPCTAFVRYSNLVNKELINASEAAKYKCCNQVPSNPVSMAPYIELSSAEQKSFRVHMPIGFHLTSKIGFSFVRIAQSPYATIMLSAQQLADELEMSMFAINEYYSQLARSSAKQPMEITAMGNADQKITYIKFTQRRYIPEHLINGIADVLLCAHKVNRKHFIVGPVSKK